MERRVVRYLRISGGVAFLASGLVTALSIAASLAGTFVACDPDLLVLCAIPIPPPPPDWTPVVALGAMGAVLVWPRRRRVAERRD